MSAHTPGPWSAGAPQYARLRRTPDKQKRPITAANHPVIANAYGEANARLIAAAPDLLEALIQANNVLEIVARISPDDVPRTGSVGQMARDAIAKATGASA